MEWEFAFEDRSVWRQGIPELASDLIQATEGKTLTLSTQGQI
jgi:hypothetical protein